jgi:hypothetical protein
MEEDNMPTTEEDSIFPFRKYRGMPNKQELERIERDMLESFLINERIILNSLQEEYENAINQRSESQDKKGNE